MLHISSKKAFSVFADGQVLPGVPFESGSWCQWQLLEAYEQALVCGARRLLVDKRAFITPWHTSVCKDSVRATGKLLNRYSARLAVVIDPFDHIEKAACLGIMQNGGKVLSTYDMGEAHNWLDGSIF